MKEALRSLKLRTRDRSLNRLSSLGTSTSPTSNITSPTSNASSPESNITAPLKERNGQRSFTRSAVPSGPSCVEVTSHSKSVETLGDEHLPEPQLSPVVGKDSEGQSNSTGVNVELSSTERVTNRKPGTENIPNVGQIGREGIVPRCPNQRASENVTAEIRTTRVISKEKLAGLSTKLRSDKNNKNVDKVKRAPPTTSAVLQDASPVLYDTPVLQQANKKTSQLTSQNTNQKPSQKTSQKPSQKPSQNELNDEPKSEPKDESVPLTKLQPALHQEVDETWLLQRQLEVELSLRKQICSNEDILQLATSFESFVVFFDELRSLSASSHIPTGVIFQEVLSRLPESNLDFDVQGGVGDIPMHQAKVLDRRPRLDDAGNIEQQVGAEKLNQFVQPVQGLRALVRVKVEDHNDLCMAEEAAKATAQFLAGLSNYATQKGQTAYQALEDLRAF